MNPLTLKAILDSAPVIIQGTSRLIKLIREREDRNGAAAAEPPMTLEGLKAEIVQLDRRVDENNRSDVEQIRLIEQLARQNETLAATLRQALGRLRLATYLALAALALAAGGLMYLVSGR